MQKRKVNSIVVAAEMRRDMGNTSGEATFLGCN